MAARGPKLSGARFSEKKSYFFEIHRTTDTSMGSAALPKRAYGLYGFSTTQSAVDKLN